MNLSEMQIILFKRLKEYGVGEKEILDLFLHN